MVITNSQHNEQRGFEWSTRLDDLRHKLASDPTNSHAWLWEIRAKILAYLLSRYGDLHQETVQRPVPRFVFPETPPHQHAQLKSRHEIRHYLQRIHLANRDSELGD